MALATIPDGFAIDIELKRWFLVEAGLLRYHVWEHIVPQIIKQTISIQNPTVKKVIEEVAVKQIDPDSRIKNPINRYEKNILNNLPSHLDVHKRPEVGIIYFI